MQTKVNSVAIRATNATGAGKTSMSTFPPRQNTAKGKWFDKMIVNTQASTLARYEK
jgi:hypothetical protein